MYCFMDITTAIIIIIITEKQTAESTGNLMLNNYVVDNSFIILTLHVNLRKFQLI